MSLALRQCIALTWKGFTVNSRDGVGLAVSNFYRGCSQLFANTPLFPIGSAVIKEHFYKIIPKHVQEQFGGVYGWCAQDCLVATTVWYKRNSYRNPVQWVFEAGTIGHGQVDEMCTEFYKGDKDRSRYLIKGWSFQDKRVLPPPSS